MRTYLSYVVMTSDINTGEVFDALKEVDSEALAKFEDLRDTQSAPEYKMNIFRHLIGTTIQNRYKKAAIDYVYDQDIENVLACSIYHQQDESKISEWALRKAVDIEELIKALAACRLKRGY
jgi:hypothetical protein